MIRFGMIGNGWRAEYYLRIARIVPDQFEVTGVLAHTREHGEKTAARFHVPVYYDLEDLLQTKPDFVIAVLPKGKMYETSCLLMERGIPVLSDTPAAPDLESLVHLYELFRATGGRMQVAEQYFLQPYHSAALRLVDEGWIGTPEDVYISMAHGIHGISLIRKYLHESPERICRIEGRSFRRKIRNTCGRKGLTYEGGYRETLQKRVSFTFEDGRTALLDFDDEQYFSPLRSRHLRVDGTDGEIEDYNVRYLCGNEFCRQEISRVDLGKDSDLQGYSLRGLMFDSRYLYRSPFEEKTAASMRRLSDDELGVGSVLLGMAHYVQTGVPFYGLEEACQDTYLSLLMEEAIAKEQPVTSQRQVWSGQA